LINRLGFNNEGAEAVAKRLQRLRASRWRPSIPIGVNIGRTRDTPLEKAAADYLCSFRWVRPVADYVTLNVSSPNTPGLRTLQDDKALDELLQIVTEENMRTSAPKPILLKIAPDLSDDDLLRIAAACEKFALAAIIATNTTIDHTGIPGELDQTGGLSGGPLRDRSTAVIQILRGNTRLPIIGAGGISDLASAQEKLQAGAELLQLYTGLIYRGPALLREIAAAV
jgi:dihydroorotate dehydrogenase